MGDKWYWHIHHDKLVEVAGATIRERKSYIRHFKPKEEQELRLKLLRPVKSKKLIEALNQYRALVRNTFKTPSANKPYDPHLRKLLPLIYKTHKEECLASCTWDENIGELVFPPPKARR